MRSATTGREVGGACTAAGQRRSREGLPLQKATSLKLGAGRPLNDGHPGVEDGGLDSTTHADTHWECER